MIEINDELFCGREDFCDAAISNGCEELSCRECHRKRPTPEQFKEEYGEEYTDDGPVWMVGRYEYSDWFLGEYAWAKGEMKLGRNRPIICACTPWGKPPKDWRPE